MTTITVSELKKIKLDIETLYRLEDTNNGISITVMTAMQQLVKSLIKLQDKFNDLETDHANLCDQLRELKGE